MPRLAERPGRYFPEVSGSVADLELVGSRLFVGGQFDSIGRGVNALLQLDMGTLALKDNLPRVTGGTSCAISDGLGGAFVAGSFVVEGTDMSNLVHVLGDGSVESVVPDVEGVITAMTWDRGTGVLYMVGSIQSVAGVARSNAAAVHVGTKTVTAWAPPLISPAVAAGAPRAVVQAGGHIWIGGQRFHGTPNRPSGVRLLRCDQVTGAIDNAEFGIDRSVDALATDGVNVYVGGEFTQILGEQRVRLAIIEASTLALSAFDMPISPGRVEAITISGGELFVGGSFGSVGSALRKSVCSFDLATLALTDWAPQLFFSSSLVRSFAVRPQTVLIGGSFSGVAGEVHNNVALVDRDTAAPLGPGLRLENSGVQGLVETATGFIIAGGSGGLVDPLQQRYLAAIDTASGTVDDTWTPSIATPVSILAANSHSLYVARFFTDNLIALDLVTGSSQPAFAPDPPGPEFPDRTALAANDTTLFVATDDLQRYALLGLDAVTGEARPEFPGNKLPGRINTLQLSRDGRVLYVGGSFTQIGSPPVFRRGVAAIDATTGAVLPWNPTGMLSVTEIHLRGNAAYMTGETDLPLQGLRNFAFAYHRQTAALLPWAPSIEDDTTTSTAALTSARGRVIIAGEFYGFEGAAADTLVAVDPTLGNGRGWQPEVLGAIAATLGTTSGVYVGGNLHGAGDASRRGLMFFPFK